MRGLPHAHPPRRVCVCVWCAPGVRVCVQVPALGTDNEFIDDLADAVMEVLPKLDEAPKSDINEGRPVSLRVVNDLVQLRGKEEEIEYGPVRYEVREKRLGFTPKVRGTCACEQGETPRRPQRRAAARGRCAAAPSPHAADPRPPRAPCTCARRS